MYQQPEDLSRRALISLINDYDKEHLDDKVVDYLHERNDDGKEYELIRPIEFVTKGADTAVGFCKTKLSDTIKEAAENCFDFLKDTIFNF